MRWSVQRLWGKLGAGLAFGLSGVARRGGPTALGSMAGLAMAATVILVGPVASAKSAYESSYGFERTWNAALRLVRVDMGLKVTEKDESTGYLLFDYRSGESGGKATSGSMEFIRPHEPSDPIRVVIQLPSMPRYHEQVLVDSLARKLRSEYGDPPAKPRSGGPSPRDAGSDAAESTE